MSRLNTKLTMGFGAVICLIVASLGSLANAGPSAAPPPDDSRLVLVMLRLTPPHFRPDQSYGGAYGDRQGDGARQRSAGRIARQYGLKVVSNWPMVILGVDCFVMTVALDQSPKEAAQTLSRDPGVVWAQTMSVYKGRAMPSAGADSLYRLQPSARLWRLTDLHKMATGRDVSVAVIDSMVQADHPDLAGQVSVRRDFVSARPSSGESHGTGVAGVIAAREGNGSGIVGVAPQARIMALRACWQSSIVGVGSIETTCDTLSLAKALEFAIEHEAKIINLSLSGPEDPLLIRLIDLAIARGATVVAAFDSDLPKGGFPASEKGVVSVSDRPINQAGSGVFTAPGRDIVTTVPMGRWFLVNGSSYSAAHVSGLFALLRQRRPGARVAESLATISPGAYVDPCATLMKAFGSCDCGCARLAGAPMLSRQ